MPNLNNLTGQRFGRLVVLDELRERKSGHIEWLCKCDCGQFTEVRGGHLKSKRIKSCGCLRKEVVSKRFYKHGGTGTRLYKVLNDMKQRCYNPNDSAYKYYGGRGISVCEEWLDNYPVFKEFALSCGYTNELTIDRKDNDGNYEPTNCHFISQAENSRKCK